VDCNKVPDSPTPPVLTTDAGVCVLIEILMEHYSRILGMSGAALQYVVRLVFDPPDPEDEDYGDELDPIKAEMIATAPLLGSNFCKDNAKVWHFICDAAARVSHARTSSLQYQSPPLLRRESSVGDQDGGGEDPSRLLQPKRQVQL
jgi:hypothetical protein